MTTSLEVLKKEQADLTKRKLGWIRIDVETHENGVVRMLPEDDRTSLPGRWARAPWLDQPEVRHEN